MNVAIPQDRLRYRRGIFEVIERASNDTCEFVNFIETSDDGKSNGLLNAVYCHFLFFLFLISKLTTVVCTDDCASSSYSNYILENCSIFLFSILSTGFVLSELSEKVCIV